MTRRRSTGLPRWVRIGALLAVVVAPLAVAPLGAAPLGAQETDPFNKLEPNNRFAIELMIDSARTLQLPADALRSVALEGIQLKADSRKIVDVVRRRFQLMKEARAVLGPVGDAELNAGVDVLAAGAKPSQLAAFRTRDTSRSHLEAFSVWTDLITRGVPGDEASSAITKLWQDGADDATFESLWRSVRTDISQGLNPRESLLNRVRETPVRPPQSKTPPDGQQENERSR